ncbi:MAG: endonuclease NucS [Gemmatimonadota bacterium]|nr:endonuclease NucS [Gemmatimonadota bacterium]
MGEYGTIKELVIDTCIAEGTFPSYEKLTGLVKQHFPASKWKKSHYAWYKSKIKTGDIVVPAWPTEADADGSESEIAAAVEASIEASVSLERDLHSYLSSRVAAIEAGLALVPNGVEYATEAGRVDLLAKDGDGSLVVIELKAGKAKDDALGQLLGYMGCLSEANRAVRGILVASSFDPRVVYAAKALASVKLVKYQVSFTMEELT